jgi:3-oxoacyl-[acyl-carrier protein] reductase
MKMGLLDGRVAVVTGAGRGIGREEALSLAAEGARVIVNDMGGDWNGAGSDQRPAAEVCEEIRARGGQAEPNFANVATEDGAQSLLDQAVSAFGDLDILVNNAGFGAFKNLVDFDRKSFDAVFATNVTGAMLMAREAAKHFIARQRGNIVNISSTAGLRGAENGTAYYASKFALRGMTECWRAELRKYNIRVFLINPSEVLTGFATVAGFPQKRNPTKLHVEDIARLVKAVLEMDDRGFTPELSVFATNPKD